MRLIDADALYERACDLEAQALYYVGKLIERDGDEVSTEWKIWSAILNERTAFKHDVFDAPTVDAVEVVRCKDCKQWDSYPICAAFPHFHECQEWNGRISTRAEDYCSRGVAREKGGENE